MQISLNAVVSIHYTLTDDTGETLDTSKGGEPLKYLHGTGALIGGLERALDGKGAGDKFTVKLAPADAYGEYDKSLVQRVPRRSLKGIGDLRVGMHLQAESNHGTQPVLVKQIVGDMVTLDANHPLAGENLTFDIEVTEVRAATEEELDHGHVHSGDGHHHHHD